MRDDCKHYQSRTYNSGEVARFCVLDMAPEAPWRCPENCACYERRTVTVGWSHGTLVPTAAEKEPENVGKGTLDMLGDAEQIVNAIAPEALKEAIENDRKREKKAVRKRRRWWPFGKRR